MTDEKTIQLKTIILFHHLCFYPKAICCLIFGKLKVGYPGTE